MSETGLLVVVVVVIVCGALIGVGCLAAVLEVSGRESDHEQERDEGGRGR